MKLFALDILKSLYYSFKSSNHDGQLAPIQIYRGSRIIMRGGVISLNPGGRLLLGKRWHGHREPMRSAYISIGDNASLIVDGVFSVLAGCTIGVSSGASLLLGDGYMNYGCEIYCGESITIGKAAHIGPGVVIRDTDDHEIIDRNYKKTKQIEIGDHVCIGQRAMIIKGVTIGHDSVVAAGTIVTKDVPPNSIVAGNPAKVIRENIAWK